MKRTNGCVKSESEGENNLQIGEKILRIEVFV